MIWLSTYLSNWTRSLITSSSMGAPPIPPSEAFLVIHDQHARSPHAGLSLILAAPLRPIRASEDPQTSLQVLLSTYPEEEQKKATQNE